MQIDADIEAFQIATRDLIGVALRSLDVLEGEVTLPQFRLLLVLHEQGRCQSSLVAKALGLGAPAVTRLADRLVRSGHVARGGDPHHRSVVTLELTDRGRIIVADVLARRHAEFQRLLAGLSADQRTAAAEALRALHTLLADEHLPAKGVAL